MFGKRLLGAVTLLAVAAVSCHSGSNGEVTTRASLASIQLAADRTASAGSPRMAITVQIAGSTLPSGLITETGSGAADYDRNIAWLHLTVSGAGTSGAPGQAIELRIVDGVLYERPPAGSIPGAKPWIKADLSGASGTQGAGASPASLTGNPAETLQYLKGASDDVTRVGEATIRGTTTEHYRLTVDLQRAAGRIPEPKRARFLQALKAFGSTTLPIDVWVDDQGRVRRMSFSAQMQLGAQGSARIEETLDLFDFGVPVAVTAPPPSEVTDIAALANRLASPSPTG